MPNKDDNPNEEVSTKPKVNKLMIVLIFFMSLLFIAMIGSLFMIMKMQAVPQAEMPEAAKSTDNTKEKLASESTDKNAQVKAEKTSESSSHAKSAKGGEGNKPQYYKLKPAIVVNIPGVDKTRFLQVDVELMTRNSSGVENVEAYAPLIRNDLITLFSTQKYDDLVTVEGKEELRKKALEIVQKVMKQNTGEPVIEQVLFTNFVSQ